VVLDRKITRATIIDNKLNLQFGGENMKKVFENKPKFFFLVEIILVAVAIITAFAAGYIYKDTVESDQDNVTEQTISIGAYKNVSSSWGTTTALSDKSITIKTDAGKSLTLNINNNTTITKGDLGVKAEKADLKKGSQVTLTYNSSNNDALNIHIGGLNE
jgi:hypothetical protein